MHHPQPSVKGLPFPLELFKVCDPNLPKNATTEIIPTLTRFDIAHDKDHIDDHLERT